MGIEKQAFDRNKTILFYTPEAGVEPHLVIQSILAKSLQDKGYKVLFAYCSGGIFSRCPTKSMYEIAPDAGIDTHSEICAKCKCSSAKILKNYGLPHIDMAQFISPELKLEVSQAISAYNGNPRDFMYKTLPLGRLAATDFVLATKKTNFSTLTISHVEDFRKYLESVLTSFLITTNLIKSLDIGRVLYFNDYGLSTSCRLAAEQLNIPAYFITTLGHRVINNGLIVALSKTYRLEVDELLENWKLWDGLALTAEQVKEIAEDSLMRLRALSPHVYSPAKTHGQQNLYTQLSLNPEKKLLVAYTSSLDEFTATLLNREVFAKRGPGTQPFEPEFGSVQVQWIRSLIEYAEQRNDLQLVVRVHPREGANRRDSNVSDHVAVLKQQFSGTYKNCRLIWPEDKISSYDLGEIADLALTTYSGMGIELARLGVPVLSAFKGISVVDHDFIEWAPTKSEYFKKLERLLNQPPSADTIRNAFRAYATYTFSFGIDFQDVLPVTLRMNEMPVYKTPREADVFEDVIINQKKITELNRLRQLELQNNNLPKIENNAIKAQLRRILHFLFTGEENCEDYALLLIDIPTSISINFDYRFNMIEETSNIRTVFISGSVINYIINGQCFQRHSPMCVRLVKVCADHIITAQNAGLTENRQAAPARRDHTV